MGTIGGWLAWEASGKEEFVGFGGIALDGGRPRETGPTSLELDCTDSLRGNTGGAGLGAGVGLGASFSVVGLGATGGFGATVGFGATSGFGAISGFAAISGFGAISGLDSTGFSSKDGFAGFGGFTGLAGFGGGTFFGGIAASGCVSPPLLKRAISAAKLGAPDGAALGAGAAGVSSACSASVYGGGGELARGASLVGRLGGTEDAEFSE